MKRVLSLVLSFILVLSMGTTAFAAEKLPKQDIKKVTNMLQRFYMAYEQNEIKTFKELCRASDTDFVAAKMPLEKSKMEQNNEFKEAHIKVLKQNKSLKYFKNLGLAYDIAIYRFATSKSMIEGYSEIQVYKETTTVYVSNNKGKYLFNGIEKGLGENKRIQWEDAPEAFRNTFVEDASAHFALITLVSSDEALKEVLKKNIEFFISNNYESEKEIYPTLLDTYKETFAKNAEIEKKEDWTHSVGDFHIKRVDKILPNGEMVYEIIFDEAIYVKATETLYLYHNTYYYSVGELNGKPVITGYFEGLSHYEYVGWDTFSKTVAADLSTKIDGKYGTDYRLPVPYVKVSE